MGINLLRNPSFEGGIRPVGEPFRSGAWPVDWLVDWWYKPEDAIIGTGSQWTLPEMIVIEYLKQFPEAEHLFGPGKFILKCFWNGAVGFGWKQTLTLPAGRYRFICPVKPDHWHQPHPGDPLVRPSPATSDDWYLASEVYAGIGTTNRVWMDAREVPIGVYTPLVREYDHGGGDLTVRFGARGRWPFRNNGWFFDGLSLEEIGAPVVVPPLPDDTAIIIQPGQLSAMRAAALEMLNRADVMHSSLEMFRSELRDMVQMFDKMLGDGT